jgi:predicted Zn-dependent protease
MQRLRLLLSQHSKLYLASKHWLARLLIATWIISGSTLAQTMKPYNEEDYSLAFSVFVAAGELENAWTVAEQAVIQQPENLIWRKRLAQISEWLQKPEIAYEQWRYLFQKNNQDKQVIEAMNRLAPAMGDDEMRLSLWLAQHNLEQLTVKQLAEVSDLFEANDQALTGAQQLEQSYARNHNPNYLSAAARLYDRMGQPSEALIRYQQLLKLPKIQSNWVLAAAIMQLRLRNPQAAQQTMQTYSAKLDDADAEFWALLGDLSWSQQQDNATQLAYQQLAKQQALNPIQQERLFAVMLTQYPEQTAQVAFAFYEQQQDIRFLIRALSYNAQQQDWLAFGQNLAKLPPATQATLNEHADFLVLRAQYYLQTKQIPLADSDIQHAATLQPMDADIQSQVLWYYIDRDDTSNLQGFVDNHRNQALSTPVFWAPFAIAYHKLNLLPQALAFYNKQLHQDPDPLMLLNYADALTASKAIGQADRVRQYAWKQLKTLQHKTAKPTPTNTAAQFAYLGLTLRNQKGDKADAQMRQLVQKLKSLPPTTAEAQQNKDLILSWAIDNNAIAAAKLWLTTNYGNTKNIKAPAWAEASLALQLNDTKTLSKLYNDSKQFSTLSPAVQHDIAQALSFSEHAAQLAFRAVEKNPKDSDMYDRYLNTYLQQANHIGVQTDQSQGDGLTNTSNILFAKFRLAPNWYGGIELGQATIKNDIDSQYSALVDQNQLNGLSLTHTSQYQQWRLAVRQHRSLESWLSTKLNVNYLASSYLTLGSELRYHMPNRDSTPMSLVGRESVFQTSATYMLTSRDSLRLSAQLADYDTQMDQHLGTGTHFDWEISHKLYRDYPDWNIRLMGAHRRYQTDDQTSINEHTMAIFNPNLGINNVASSILPSDTNYYAACLGAGQNLAQRRNLDGSDATDINYTKAWRPLAEVCTTYNTTSDTIGYSGLGGIRGSIDGEDQLLLFYQEANGGLQLPNQTLKTLSAKYERLF